MRRCPVRGIQALLLALSVGSSVHGQTPASEIPPTPTQYFTDQAGVIDPTVGERINQQLEQFEQQTSTQILVAIYPKLPEDAEIASYTTDVFHAWKVGQKDKDNGAVLFVFTQDHKLKIVTGRGLEGALPDATCSTIIRHEIVPAFKQGDFSGGIQAGVNAMLAATKGEYQGDGTTVNQAGDDANHQLPGWAVILIILVILLFIIMGPRMGGGGGPMIFYGGGGGFGGGGFGGGGGGGFSGGGGDSAGGGAGGSW